MSEIAGVLFIFSHFFVVLCSDGQRSNNNFLYSKYAATILRIHFVKTHKTFTLFIGLWSIIVVCSNTCATIMIHLLFLDVVSCSHFVIVLRKNFNCIYPLYIVG